MFLKKRIVNNTLYWSIAENYRKEGKMKQRIILNLGNTNKAREILKSNPKYSYFLYYVIDPKTIGFSISDCNDDWSYLTDTNEILVEETIYLTKEQIIETIDICHHIERFRYGYSLYYIYKGRKVNLCMRLINNSTRKRESAKEYIEKYFDTTAAINELGRKSIFPQKRKLIDEHAKEYLSKVDSF